MTFKVIQGHKIPPLCQNHSFMGRIWWKFAWMIISSRQKFSLNKTFILFRCFVFFFFYFKTFWPKYNLDLLTYEQLLSLFFFTACNQSKITHGLKIMRLSLTRSYRFLHNYTKKERESLLAWKDPTTHACVLIQAHLWKLTSTNSL